MIEMEGAFKGVLRCTSSVHGAVVVQTAGLRQGDKQAADGVQGVAHPALQVGGGGETSLEQL